MILDVPLTARPRQRYREVQYRGDPLQHPYTAYDGRGPEPAHMPQLSHLHPSNLLPTPDVVYPHHHHHHHHHPSFPLPPPHHHMMQPIGTHMMAPHAPFLLQPTHASMSRPGYHEDYLRLVEQRRTMENHRGASKRCIELNTFPHKFKKVQTTKQDDDEDDVDKCTICLCGEF